MFHVQNYTDIVCIFHGDSLDTIDRYCGFLSLPYILVINSVFMRKAR